MSWWRGAREADCEKDIVDDAALFWSLKIIWWQIILDQGSTNDIVIWTAYINISNSGQYFVLQPWIFFKYRAVSNHQEPSGTIRNHQEPSGTISQELCWCTDSIILANLKTILQPNGMYLMMRTNEPKSWGKNVPTTIKLSGRSQQAVVMTLKK